MQPKWLLVFLGLYSLSISKSFASPGLLKSALDDVKSIGKDTFDTIGSVKDKGKDLLKEGFKKIEDKLKNDANESKELPKGNSPKGFVDKIEDSIKDKGKDFLGKGIVDKLKDGAKEIGKIVIGELDKINKNTTNDILELVKETSKNTLRFLVTEELRYRSKNANTGFFSRIKSFINALLNPKCNKSKKKEKKLRKLAKTIKPTSEKLLRVVDKLEEETKKAHTSIDRVIRDLENDQTKKAAEKASIFLRLPRNALQVIANILYNIHNTLLKSEIISKIIPTIRGLINIHTTIANYIIVKGFCLLESLIPVSLFNIIFKKFMPKGKPGDDDDE